MKFVNNQDTGLGMHSYSRHQKSPAHTFQALPCLQGNSERYRETSKKQTANAKTIFFFLQ